MGVQGACPLPPRGLRGLGGTIPDCVPWGCKWQGVWGRHAPNERECRGRLSPLPWVGASSPATSPLQGEEQRHAPNGRAPPGARERGGDAGGEREQAPERDQAESPPRRRRGAGGQSPTERPRRGRRQKARARARSDRGAKRARGQGGRAKRESAKPRRGKRGQGEAAGGGQSPPTGAAPARTDDAPRPRETREGRRRRGDFQGGAERVAQGGAERVAQGGAEPQCLGGAGDVPPRPRSTRGSGARSTRGSGALGFRECGGCAPAPACVRGGACP